MSPQRGDKRKVLFVVRAAIGGVGAVVFVIVLVFVVVYWHGGRKELCPKQTEIN